MGLNRLYSIDAEDAEEFRIAMIRIDELRKLERGWLDGNGEAISQIAIEAARSALLQRPDIAKSKLGIFPTEEGGLTFEFTGNAWQLSIEIMPSGSIEFYGIQVDGTETVGPILCPVPVLY